MHSSCYDLLASMNTLLLKPRKWLNSTPIKAGVLLAVFLSVLVLAQLETLHQVVHADASETTHECAVTLLSAGKVSLTEGTVAVVLAEPFPMTEVESVTVLAGITAGLLPPARAPPTLRG